MAPDFDTLFQAAARGLQAVLPAEDQDLGRILQALLGSLSQFDEVVVFAYRGKDRPIELFSTFAPEEYAVFVSLYQAGPYLLDPFYHQALAMRPGAWRMRELAPDRFFSSEYRRTYYVQTGLAEELGYFVPCGGGISVVLSLMRKERSGTFADREFALLRTAEPLVRALVQRSWGDLSPRFDREAHGKRLRRSPLRSTDQVWDAMNLTKREAAIVELVLQGHSSESIGLRLGISTGTVKVHRRNVYRKLGITSQTQLMSIYLRGLSH
ncbi:LuxR family transcriptional regulator [Aureimonas sp. Leaf454]|uniref:helix-turn-helix transcriptional regulator n=1 Tax=Aureimonas sp. Leaf454 TaxID=1736381 RepID=UPI0006F8A976|nr:helix-turn-helix transcriptional regulator [Aureimonas sp. Leaf454]KQT54519.1 LuxR family transcriptional regulator [Aureimonas sp. Leaf454]